jgi:hypothetical protein
MSNSWITTRFTNPANSSITAKYIQIKKFQLQDSITILNALKNKDDSVYFQDTTGNIRVNSTQFINPLLTKPWDNTVSLSSYKVSLNPKSKYIFSKPHGLWALYYKTDGSLYMLYNPIPRPEWSKTYINSNYSKDIYNSTVDVCTATESEDPVCGCINLVSSNDTEFCMDQLVAGGDSIKRREIKYSTINPGTTSESESGPGSGTWNSISNVCHCSNQKCSKSHPFEKSYLINNKCPDHLTVAICSIGLEAGGNITQTSPTSFQQSCTNISGEASTPSPPTPSPPTPSDTPSDSPSTDTDTDTDPKRSPGPQGTKGESGQYTNNELTPLSPIKKILYIGGGIIVIALVAYLLYSVLFSSQNLNNSIVKLPVVEPVKIPVIEAPKLPVIEPVKLPVVEPVKLPVVEPVKLPVVEPVKLPVVEPVKLPVIEPVKLPVVEPVKIPVIEAPKLPVIEAPKAPLIEPVKAAFKASFRFKRR